MALKSPAMRKSFIQGAFIALSILGACFTYLGWLSVRPPINAKDSLKYQVWEMQLNKQDVSQFVDQRERRNGVLLLVLGGLVLMISLGGAVLVLENTEAA